MAYMFLLIKLYITTPLDQLRHGDPDQIEQFTFIVWGGVTLAFQVGLLAAYHNSFFGTSSPDFIPAD
jgi:hypothetical protein